MFEIIYPDVIRIDVKTRTKQYHLDNSRSEFFYFGRVDKRVELALFLMYINFIGPSGEIGEEQT